MQDWNMQSVLNDLEYIKSQIQAAHPGQKPVVRKMRDMRGRYHTIAYHASIFEV
jgi:hypothetical protein